MATQNKQSLFRFDVLMLTMLIAIFCSPKSNSSYNDVKKGNGIFNTAEYQIKVNNSTNLSQVINLEDTITSNNYSNQYVAPGSTGDIKLVLDFSNVDVSTNYTINLGTYDLPANLKLYSESTYTREFSSISGSFLINSTPIHTYHIYWKWIYAIDDVSNANDNLYMNHSLSVLLNISTIQRFEGGSK